MSVLRTLSIGMSRVEASTRHLSAEMDSIWLVLTVHSFSKKQKEDRYYKSYVAHVMLGDCRRMRKNE